MTIVIVKGNRNIGEAKDFVAMQLTSTVNDATKKQNIKQMTAEGGSYGEPIYVTVPDNWKIELEKAGFEIMVK